MNIQKHYLRPGELLVTREPAQVTTVLGSCVSVTLFHPASRTAGICHGVLPFGEGDPREPGRYMVSALLIMITDFARQGVPSHSLQAKIFGGAALFTDASPSERVGSQNVRVAAELLARHRIPILAKNVGGVAGRKIVFHTATGDVYHKLLCKTFQDSTHRCAAI